MMVDVFKGLLLGQKDSLIIKERNSRIASPHYHESEQRLD
jgi:hypothetical protein